MFGVIDRNDLANFNVSSVAKVTKVLNISHNKTPHKERERKGRNTVLPPHCNTQKTEVKDYSSQSEDCSNFSLCSSTMHRRASIPNSGSDSRTARVKDRKMLRAVPESIGVILVHPKMNLKLHIVGRIRLRHIRITALALKLVTGSLLHSKQLLKKKET
jgi:hypothetical protein